MGKEEEPSVILYDLPSKQGTSWSGNPWKARMVLNYKGVDYKTEWLEYPDVAPRLKSFGISPHSNAPEYTIPALKTADGEYIMDSKNIAAHLEKKYPAGEYPTIKLDEPIQQRVEDLIAAIFGAMAPVVLPLIPRNILNPASADYFNETRAKRFGMSLDEFEASKGGEQAWKNAEASIDELAAILKDADGPYTQGDKSCYADFYIVTWLHFIKRIDEKLFDRVVKDRRELSSLYTVMSAYLDKTD